jgi:hypothetical protein
MLILLIILFLVFGGGGGYSFGNRWNPGYGPGVSLGTVVVGCLTIWLLGGFGGLHGSLLR